MGVFGTVWAGVYIFGFLRLNLALTTESDETIRVAGITAETQRAVYDQVGGMMNWIKQSETGRLAVQSHWEAYFDETVREAQAGAKLVIWPEIAGLTYNSDAAALIARSQDVALQNGIYLAVPLAIFYPPDSEPLYENRLILIDPTGTIVMDHVKYGGAITSPGMLVGDGKLQTVNTPFGVLSGVICWDQDYPSVIRQAGWNGTGLMLVPSYDWLEIDPLHSQMAVFRAIENGLSLVRQTDAGLSIAVDPYGRVLAQTDFFGATDPTMIVQVPVKHVKTVYSLFGSWLEWLAPAGFLILVVLAVATSQSKEK